MQKSIIPLIQQCIAHLKFVSHMKKRSGFLKFQLEPRDLAVLSVQGHSVVKGYN